MNERAKILFYYPFLGRREPFLSHSLDKEINSCGKGPGVRICQRTPNFWYIHRWIQYLNIFLNFSAEFCIFVQCIWSHQIIAKHSVPVFVSDSEFVLHFKYLVVLCLDSYVFGSFIPGEGEHCTEWWAFKSSSKSSRKSSKSRSSVGEEIPRFDTAIFRKISFTTNSKNIFGI